MSGSPSCLAQLVERKALNLGMRSSSPPRPIVPFPPVRLLRQSCGCLPCRTEKSILVPSFSLSLLCRCAYICYLSSFLARGISWSYLSLCGGSCADITSFADLLFLIYHRNPFLCRERPASSKTGLVLDPFLCRERPGSFKKGPSATSAQTFTFFLLLGPLFVQWAAWILQNGAQHKEKGEGAGPRFGGSRPLTAQKGVQHQEKGEGLSWCGAGPLFGESRPLTAPKRVQAAGKRWRSELRSKLLTAQKGVLHQEKGEGLIQFPRTKAELKFRALHFTNWASGLCIKAMLSWWISKGRISAQQPPHRESHDQKEEHRYSL